MATFLCSELRHDVPVRPFDFHTSKRVRPTLASLFWICLLLGGGVVILQLLASLIGLDGGDVDADLGVDAPDDVGGHGDLSDGLHLFSVRALSAGVAFFGVGGLIALKLGLHQVLAVPMAAVSGLLAATGVATLLNSMRKLESDRTIRIANAIGKIGDVYLSIPGQESGIGKIMITIQERQVEIAAMTREDGIASGTRVLVIDTVSSDTVVVVPEPKILEETNSDS